MVIHRKIMFGGNYCINSKKCSSILAEDMPQYFFLPFQHMVRYFHVYPSSLTKPYIVTINRLAVKELSGRD